MSTTTPIRAGRFAHARTWALTVVALATVASSCSSGTRTGSGSGAGESIAPDASVTPAESSEVPAPADPDRELAEAALLAPADLEGNWRDTGPEGDFPMSAELARTAPACTRFADLVFDGGAQHGAGATVTLQRQEGLLYTYVVVFPTNEEAATMMRAVTSTEFDGCWSQFMGVAAVEAPYGITEASYEKATPPDMKFVADSYVVRHVIGTIVVDGSEGDDTCVCVFAQVGRGVVIVHSALPHFSLDERVAMTQTAIDKLRDVLG